MNVEDLKVDKTYLYTSAELQAKVSFSHMSEGRLSYSFSSVDWLHAYYYFDVKHIIYDKHNHEIYEAEKRLTKFEVEKYICEFSEIITEFEKL